MRSRFTIVLGVIALVVSTLGGMAAAQQGPPDNQEYLIVNFQGDNEARPSFCAGGWELGQSAELTVSDETGILYGPVPLVFEPNLNDRCGPPGPTVAELRDPGEDALGDFWLEPGQTVTVSGCEFGTDCSVPWVRSIVVSPIRLLDIDYDTDTVTGDGLVSGHLMNNCMPGTTVSEGGSWVVDLGFCGIDLKPYESHDLFFNDMVYPGFTHISLYAWAEPGLFTGNVSPITGSDFVWHFGGLRANSDGVVRVLGPDSATLLEVPVSTDEFGGFQVDPLGFDLEAGMTVIAETGRWGRLYSHITLFDVTVDADFDADTATLAVPGFDGGVFVVADPGPEGCATEVLVTDGAAVIDYTTLCDGYDLAPGATFVIFLDNGEGNTQRAFIETTVVPESRDDCKNGGWQDVTRADGTPFKNQGQCIKYVNTGR